MGKISSVKEHETHNKEALEAKKNKTRWSLVPWDMFKEVGDVFTEGAKKYEDEGWKYCSIDDYRDAMSRHFIAFMSGEMLDSASGHSHLHHIISNCLILLWLTKEKQSGQKEKR